jgi:hypothetical protein
VSRDYKNNKPHSIHNHINMASLADPQNPAGKFNFPGPLGSKRRRMRSGGNVSTQTNNAPRGDPANPIENISEQKTTQTSKCKGATTIPIFLKSKLVEFPKKMISVGIRALRTTQKAWLSTSAIAAAKVLRLAVPSNPVPSAAHSFALTLLV